MYSQFQGHWYMYSTCTSHYWTMVLTCIQFILFMNTLEYNNHYLQIHIYIVQSYGSIICKSVGKSEQESLWTLEYNTFKCSGGLLRRVYHMDAKWDQPCYVPFWQPEPSPLNYQVYHHPVSRTSYLSRQKVYLKECLIKTDPVCQIHYRQTPVFLSMDGCHL